MATWDICVLAAQSDSEDASRLAESIRRYRLPADITLSQDDADYRRILVDTQEAPFDGHVQEQLDASRTLVVLCSPNAKASAAVDQRLSAFLATHDRDCVIAVIVRGEPDEAFPESFRERKVVRHILPNHRVIERMETIEPVAADLRADTAKRKRQLLRYETVRIVASVLHLHPDDLEQRQHARQRRALVRVLSIAAAVVIAISGIFIRLGLIARRESRIADEQTRLSVETARRTMHDLPELFADEPLALGYIDEAIEDARSSLAELGQEELLDGTESGG